jgi:hypothetical protein
VPGRCETRHRTEPAELTTIGVIHSADAPDRRAVLQVVGKRVDISMENQWDSRTPGEAADETTVDAAL